MTGRYEWSIVRLARVRSRPLEKRPRNRYMLIIVESADPSVR